MKNISYLLCIKNIILEITIQYLPVIAKNNYELKKKYKLNYDF